ncbi:MAG: inorganic phosphate transporter, partial [Candidatus Thorarchaeota archaeon]
MQSILQNTLILALVLFASISALAIGANDNTMASVVGAKVLSLKSAVLLCGSLFIIGAIILGPGVSETIGFDFVTISLPFNTVVIIILAMTIWLLLASYLGYPISATHSIIGSVVGIAIFEILNSGNLIIRLDTLALIVIGWAASPILALIIAYGLQFFVQTQVSSRVFGLDDVKKQEGKFGWLLLIMVSIIAFSRGGNDVSKAVGLITILTIQPLDLLLIFFIGGLGMAIGLFFLGRRVVQTVGNELTELRPSTSFSAATGSAIILFLGTLFGLPIAATHVLIASLIGAVHANKRRINYSILRRLTLASVITMPISALFACILVVMQ